MDKINNILDNLREGVPQALARFNDGEAQAIVQPDCTVARGDQYVSPGLSNALHEAIQYEQENYWIGLPCDVCATEKWYHKIKHLVRPDYEYLTKAVVTTNRNWKLFTEELPKILKNKPVHWVGSKEQQLNKLPFKVYNHIHTNSQNAWEQYKDIISWATDIYPTRDDNDVHYLGEGEIVILACGPLSRVLVRHWFEKRPNCTFLDVGSAFDPWTRNVWHNCHKGTLGPCKGCN
jgi:hypothetical protein